MVRQVGLAVGLLPPQAAITNPQAPISAIPAARPFQSALM
jgi:hypothetical protein